MKQVCKTCYREECKTCYKPCYANLLQTSALHDLQAVLQDVQQGSVPDLCKPCYETCYKECRYTVCKGCRSAAMKECCYTVCKPVCETHCHKCCHQACHQFCETHCHECCYTVCKPVCETCYKDVCCTTCKPCMRDLLQGRAARPATRIACETCYKHVQEDDLQAGHDLQDGQKIKEMLRTVLRARQVQALLAAHLRHCCFDPCTCKTASIRRATGSAADPVPRRRCAPARSWQCRTVCEQVPCTKMVQGMRDARRCPTPSARRCPTRSSRRCRTPSARWCP